MEFKFKNYDTLVSIRYKKDDNIRVNRFTDDEGSNFFKFYLGKVMAHSYGKDWIEIVFQNGEKFTLFFDPSNEYDLVKINKLISLLMSPCLNYINV